jgi:hypothetical protein
MKANSIKGNSEEEIKTALDELIAEGFKPTLAFVFISVKQDREAVDTMLDYEGIQVFGATTGGEFIDGDIEAGSMVCRVLYEFCVYYYHSSIP